MRQEIPPLYLDGSLDEVKGQSVLISLAEIKNFDYYRYLIIIVSRLINQGNSITFLSVASTLSSINFLPRWFESKKFKSHKLLFILYKSVFLQTLQDLKLPYQEIEVDFQPEKRKRKFKKIKQIISDTKIDTECKKSILSILATHSVKSLEPEARLRVHESNQVNHMINSFEEIVKLVKPIVSDKFTVLVVLNARMPEQAAIRRVASDLNTQIYHFEHGSQPRQSFCFDSFAPQNVYQRQIVFQRMNHDLSIDMPEIASYADRWFKTRIYKSIKTYDEFEKDSVRLPAESSRSALICTSSLNEFSIYSDYSNDVNQCEMIRMAVVKLINEGFKVTVRVHPNEIKNNWTDLIKLNRYLRGLSVTVIQPWNCISTYLLVEEADLVVTWDSTIGLEASYMNKPVYIMNESFYSVIAKTPKITRELLAQSEPIFLPYTQNMRNILLAAYLNLAYGYSLHKNSAEIVKLQSLHRNYSDIQDKITNVVTSYKQSFVYQLGIFWTSYFSLRFPSYMFRYLRFFCGEKVSISILNFSMKLIRRGIL